MSYKFNPFTGNFDRVVKGSNPPFQTTQNLNAGANVIAHNLNKDVYSFTVKDAVGNIVQADGTVTDANNFEITLAGGNIPNAVITLEYV